MLIRALIVLLLILNVGVAAWWLTRSPSQEAPTAPAQDVPRLQLADGQQPPPEAGIGDTAAVAPAATPAAAEHCASHGPFASPETAAEAGQRVRSSSTRVRIRAEATGPYAGWKVWLPPYASPAEVEEVARRVAAAGFNDQFIVRDGRDANSLALGRFTGEVPARQHAARLVAAGFPARAEPIGTGPVTHWLDVAGPAADTARLRSLVGAPEVRERDCATWR